MRTQATTATFEPTSDEKPFTRLMQLKVSYVFPQRATFRRGISSRTYCYRDVRTSHIAEERAYLPYAGRWMFVSAKRGALQLNAKLRSNFPALELAVRHCARQ